MAQRPPVQFDTLLRIRERQEDLCAEALAKARRDVAVTEQDREGIVRMRFAMLQEAGQRAHSAFDAADVRSYYQFERHLARLTDEKDAWLVKLRAVAEARRSELEEAMKRRRIIEKLIERKRGAFVAEARKEEQKMADETAANYAAIARYGHRTAALKAERELRTRSPGTW